MYIPKSKYKAPKFTRGNEFTFVDGKPYIGWYIELFNGNYLTGKAPVSNSKSLVPVEIPTVKVDITLSTVIIPTEKDYNNGFFFRYFTFDNRTRKIKEVNLETFRNLQQKGYITGVRLRWRLTSPGDDLIINGYKYEGSGTVNEREIQRAEQQIPGIREILNNPKQFVL